MEVRHFARNRYRMAEISVPACPIPIQNTKVVMYIAHNLRRALARGADADPDLPGPRRHAARQREGHQAHPGEVLLARHPDGADDVAVDVGPGGRGGSAWRSAHDVSP